MLRSNSGSKWNEESFSRSLESNSRSCSNSAASAGNRPQNTTGTEGLKPASMSAAGLRSSVMVSPTLQSAMVLMPAMMKPTSPGPSSATSLGLGVKTPTLSRSYDAAAAIMRMRMPFLSTPSLTRTRVTTPRYGSYQLSTSSAFRGALRSPTGGGRRLTIASRRSSMPRPVLADTLTASDVSMPITSSISWQTRSASAEGRSILFRTGMISWLASIA